VKESQKWLIGAISDIDQLRATLEDDMEVILSMISGLDKNEKDTYTIAAANLAKLFLLETMKSKLESEESLRCGLQVDDFVKFLNNETDEVQ
jgi:hypothetical protein